MNKTDSIISAILAGFIGVILLTVLVPIMTEQIATMTGDAATKYGPILYAIPIMLGVGIIIGIFKFFNGGSR